MYLAIMHYLSADYSLWSMCASYETAPNSRAIVVVRTTIAGRWLVVFSLVLLQISCLYSTWYDKFCCDLSSSKTRRIYVFSLFVWQYYQLLWRCTHALFTIKRVHYSLESIQKHYISILHTHICTRSTKT